MKNTVELVGIENVLKNINKEFQAMHLRVFSGLIVSAIIVRRSMEETEPLIPIDLGNLRASWFTVTRLETPAASMAFTGDNAAKMAIDHAISITDAKQDADQDSDPVIILGFSANYALWVHEMVDAIFQRPGAGAKFLEAALKRNKNAILRAIADSAKIQ